MKTLFNNGTFSELSFNSKGYSNENPTV